MTEVPVTFGQARCNGATPPENGQRPITKITEETTDAYGTLPHYRVDPRLEDLCTEGNQEESEKSQGNMPLTWSTDEQRVKEKPEEKLLIVHKAITDLSLQETSADEMIFREGHQWEKIPLSSSNQEVIRQMEKIAGKSLEEREDGARKNKVYQETEIKWLGFRKPSKVDMLHSKHDEEQEGWDEEASNDDDDDCNDDEDVVRVMEFMKKNEEGPQLKEEDDANEDSPLSSPSSQPATPDY
ncbi:ermin isoform X2 [Choloepus didactylus]|uniref:ermin isoform X2 n=1 Tax=Choloepus didactylus TaxID=27675 RepID=UPI00189EB230|nr:ermin isoform X2 [Choloepus didactylus]